MPEHRRIFFYSIVISLLLLAGAPFSARAQDGGTNDWQTLRPEGEEFTIVMPKDPKFEESREPYHRDMTLNTRLYLSAAPKGPVLAVVSLSGIKANSPGYNDFMRLNSYVDAFKNWFPQKVRGKDAVAKLTLVGEKTLYGNVGREYRIVIGDLSGTARVFATRRRFYAAVALNTKKDDELTDQFLSSFVLPEKIAQPQETVVGGKRSRSGEFTIDGTDNNAESAAARKAAANKENAEDTQKPDAASDSSAEVKPGDSESNSGRKPGEKAPISGGVLNGKALSLPQPAYPPIAEQAKAAGNVMVQVVIDEAGNVISAHATSGHPLLQAAAAAAARQAKFAPTSLMGEPVKVTGVLIYTFVAR